VILKILNPQLSSDDTELARFVQELKLTRKVSAKNVIRIFDLLDLGGVHAVSMEYFESRDLRAILDAETALPPRRTLEMVLQICDGLGAAHDEDVIHRDIKPPNVLVGANDTIKIVDFGLARAQQRVGSRLTKSGNLIGTPEYMAPELITEDAVDLRVDIYSLGIMMYEMLSGRRPYAAENVVKLLFQHLEGEAPALGSLVPGLSPEIERIVSSAMARDPGDRPATVRELRARVESVLATLPAETEQNANG
jgi:serine/threonine-protein kinase